MADEIQRPEVYKHECHHLQSRVQDFTCKMNNDILTRTDEQKYVGVMLTSDLK